MLFKKMHDSYALFYDAFVSLQYKPVLFVFQEIKSLRFRTTL